jgi:hypothetical protein
LSSPLFRFADILLLRGGIMKCGTSIVETRARRRTLVRNALCAFRSAAALTMRQDLSGSVDNEIRPTSSSRPIEDIRLIVLSDCRELRGTPSTPAVRPQKRSKVFPCFPFAPGVSQGSAPAASGLEVCGRGRVDEHPDGVSPFLIAKPEEFGDESS